jgi:hypothetical protein
MRYAGTQDTYPIRKAIRMKFRKGLTTVTLAVAATALGGSPAFATCGQQSSEGHRAQPVAHEQHAKDVTSKASIVAKVDGATPAEVHVDGAINYTKTQGAFDINATANGASEQSKLIIDGTNVYVQVPPDQQSATGGKEWIKEDIAAQAQAMGFDMNMLMSGDDNSMNSMLQNVQLVGKENVRGVRTKHYTAQLDLSKLAKEGTEASDATAKPINVDVWMDRKDRVRKVSFDLAAEGATVSVSVELYEYGTPVDVTVPSDNEVFTAPVTATPQPAEQKQAA